MFCLSKKYNWVKRVCVIDSAYSLFIYFLLSSEEEIASTFFFWGNGVPKEVKDHFKGQSCQATNYYLSPKRIYRMYIRYIEYPIRYPFLLKDDIDIWGHDHLFSSGAVIRNHKINIIEDGMFNYFSRQVFKGKMPRWYYYMIEGRTKFYKEYFFLNPWCKAEYLTGLIPDAACMHSAKCVKINIEHLWNSSSQKKKQYISSLYGIDLADIEFLKKYDRILLTQPFEGSERGKIEYYRHRLSEIGSEKLLIKPHPRETTNYNSYFPDIPIFAKKIPLELLSLFGLKFKQAYTVNSTSIYNLPIETERIVWDKDHVITRF